MPTLLNWLKTATVKVLDPHRDQRLATFAGEVWRQITQQKRGFDFLATMTALGADVEDNQLVAERVYEDCLRRAWKDQEISATERESLDLIARLLHLEPRKARELSTRLGLAVFESNLADVFADGRLDPHEAQRLARIATSIGTTTRALMQHYFANTGEALLRGMFAGVLEGETFTDRDWRRLIEATAGLGLHESELQEFIRPQAEQYVEHVLADAKADERITPHERGVIQWLLDTFGLTPAFRQYVWSEVQMVEQMDAVRQGQLPVIAVRDVSLRAGELPHYQCHAAFAQVRQYKNGARVQRHDGFATITDVRLIFSSATKSVDLNHRNVVGILSFEGGVEVRAGRGSGYYYLGDNPNLATAIYEAAIAKANQTLVQKSAGSPSRHISRDVRQRVWQQYGGRCADCHATQYLEFDHIIPVAKGGSNDEANVQLLCRGCNSKKSDRI